LLFAIILLIFFDTCLSWFYVWPECKTFASVSLIVVDSRLQHSPAYMLQQSSLAGEISQQRDSISRRMAGRCVNHILNFVILASQGNPLSLVCKISYCMYAPSPSPNIASLFDPFLHQS